MDPNAFSANFFKWDPRSTLPPPNRMVEAVVPPPPAVGGLEELFQAYGVRYYTAAKLAELGFTVSTLLGMRDEELDEMMDSLCHIFRWDLLVGERYGIKSAVRAERRRLMYVGDGSHSLDSLSQEGFIDKPAQQQEKEVAGSGSGTWQVVETGGREVRMRKNNNKRRPAGMANSMDDDDDDEGADVAEDEETNGGGERQREHPFIVTEPGEVARGKKNGLDYLFHLYEVCHELLVQVQNIAREKGEKCPTKVTNQVFRYAKLVGANHINKPKMRHYVHCYALHCLDEAASNSLRRVFKERRENVGAWRQACYMPLVAIAAGHGWDIDAVFNAHARLSIWYVPTKLRQLCHAERSNATSSSSVTGGGADHLPF
ncbi:hypothetical protein CASFOL_037973 [Castilleja foliolosa]|uniref:Floricaula/leafy-like transcription factor n=1 Tax=Castilleja foliolosa TaxID=1961234 RepID=A0ABD3BK39_9LAMI